MSALKKDGLQVWLRRAVWLLLLGSFGCIFLVIALRGHGSLGPRRMLFCALLAAGFGAAALFATGRQARPRPMASVVCRRVVLLFALQLGSGFLLLQDLTTSPFDTEAVLRTATELARRGTPTRFVQRLLCQRGRIHSDVTADFGQAFF